jgi:hypothetical protein
VDDKYDMLKNTQTGCRAKDDWRQNEWAVCSGTSLELAIIGEEPEEDYIPDEQGRYVFILVDRKLERVLWHHRERKRNKNWAHTSFTRGKKTSQNGFV